MECQLCYLSQVIIAVFVKQKTFSLFSFFSSTMMLNSFAQQIPVVTGANLLNLTMGIHRPPPFDPLAEIRNG